MSTHSATADRARHDDAQAMARRAVALATLAAVAVSTAPLLGGARAALGAVGGPSVAGAITAAALALAVPLLAAWALLRGRFAAVGALVVSAGVIAVGAVVLDIGLLTSTIDANRLELFRPLSAAGLTPGPGSFLVIGGHVLGVVAAAAGLAAIARAGLLDDNADADSADVRDGIAGAAARIGAWPSILATLAALTVAGALYAPSFESTDPVFLVPSVLASAGSAAFGTTLVALGLLVVLASALASESVSAASGALIGGALAVGAIVAPRLVSAWAAGDRIEPGVGSLVGTVAAGVLLVTGALAPTFARRRAHRSESVRSDVPAAPPNSTRTPRSTGSPRSTRAARTRAAAEAAAAARSRSNRRHAVAGVMGIVAGFVLVIGAFLPLIAVPDGVSEPTIAKSTVVVVAAVVLVALSVLLLFPDFGALVRPAAGVFVAAVVMAALSVLQTLVLALDLPGLRPGLGAAVIGVGAALTLTAGLALAVAGSAERDDVDLVDAPQLSRSAGALGLGGAAAATVSLAVPLYSGGIEPAASFSTFPFGWNAWGQAGVAVVIVVAVLIARRARPVRAAGMFVGCLLCVLIHLAQWPLAATSDAGVQLGPGAIAAVVAAVLLLAAALFAGRTRQ